MVKSKVTKYIQNILPNIPEDWVKLTTHRLDIYNEDLAKTEFLDKFEDLYANNDHSAEKLAELPTAYDYIRLGHPPSLICNVSKSYPYTLRKSSKLKCSGRFSE